MGTRDHTQEKILGLEKRNILLNRGVHEESMRLTSLDKSIDDVQAAILLARLRQANFAPAGSALRRVGASSLAIELKRYRKRQMDDLEKELARSRRVLDEASRVVTSKREEINLLRKQAMVLNEEFLRRSNDLDRAKVNLAICLEQANQIVKAKQFVQEQSDDLRADATKDRQAWIVEREAVIARIRRLLEGNEAAIHHPHQAGEGEPDVFGNLTTEQEEYALQRVKQLVLSIERLEKEAPFEQAELDVWESAFKRMQEGTGEGDADRLVARFLAEEEVNYQLYNYIATVSEDADALEAQLASVHAEIAAGGQDTHAMRLHEETSELRTQLAETEYQLHEQSTRERQLVSQLHGVAAQLVKMYKQLNCPGAAAAWTKQAKDTAVRSIHGAPLASAPSAHNLVAAAMHQRSQQQPDAPAAAQPPQPVPTQGARSWLPGGPRRSGAGLAPAPAAAAVAASDNEQKSDAPPSDAWVLLGEDAPQRTEDQAAVQAQPQELTHKASMGPGGLAKRGKQTRAPTPPRNLFEIAGLTGNMRGQGYELLLAEGVVGAALESAAQLAAAADDEDSAEQDGKRSASPALKIITDSSRVMSASNLLQPGSPFMRGVTGEEAYYDGEEGASPRAAARRAPLVRHFSLSEADLLANTLMPPEQQAKVQAQTILSYMTILERRVQQLAAEFDTVVVTSRGNSSQFGVRGPRVEHDKDRHTFHVEPPPLEEFVEELDTTFLNSLQQQADTLLHARRASLASMVDGEATAPQGPAASSIAIAESGVPVVKPRFGTTYSSTTANAEAAQRAISAAALMAAGGRRPSTRAASPAVPPAGAPPAAPSTPQRPGTSSVAGSARRAGSESKQQERGRSRMGSRMGSSVSARPPQTPMYRSGRAAGTATPAASKESSASGSGFPVSPSGAAQGAAGQRVTETLNRLGSQRSRSQQAGASASPSPSSTAGNEEGAPLPPAGVAGGSSRSASPLHLVERTVGAAQLSSHGKGRVIVSGVHPASFVPPRRQAYLDWVARQQQQQQQSASAAGASAEAGGAPAAAEGTASGDGSFFLPPPAMESTVRTSTFRSDSDAGDRDADGGATGAPSPSPKVSTNIDSRVQALRSPVRSVSLAQAAAGSPMHSSRYPSPSPSAATSPSRTVAASFGATAAPSAPTTTAAIAASNSETPFSAAVYGAGASSDSIPGASLHGSASLPFLGGPRSHVPGTPAAAGSSAHKYPKVLYSGYRISNVNHESGPDFAYYSTAAARKRMQYASLSDANVAHPADMDALLRDVQRQYGQANTVSLDDGTVDPRIANRASRISAYVHYGKLDEETLRERARQRETERRKESRRRSLQIEMQGLKKQARGSTAHRAQGGEEGAAGSDGAPLFAEEDELEGGMPRGGNARPALQSNRGGKGADAAPQPEGAGSRRESRVDPLAVAAGIAMRLDRDSAAAAPKSKGGSAAAAAAAAKGPARMTRAARAAMDAEVDDALQALGEPPRAATAEPSGEGGSVSLPALPQAQAVRRPSEAQGGTGSGGGALGSSRSRAADAAPASARADATEGAALPQLPT